MADIQALKAARFKEIENKRHSLNMRKTRKEHNNEFTKVVEKNTDTIKALRKDYEVKVRNEKVDIQRKLAVIRKLAASQMAKENSRLETEMTDIRMAHTNQVDELRENLHKTIQNQEQENKEVLDNARQRYLEELRKYKS